MSGCSNAKDALAFVKDHGVVLVSAKSSAPSLVEAIVGQRVKGSWWAHPEGKRIFAILKVVTESEHVLVCRLVNGKVTLVHERLWPSLVRLAKRLSPEQLARVQEEHTSRGRHVTHEVPFPKWVPVAVTKQADALSEQEALDAFGAFLPPTDTRANEIRRSRTSGRPRRRDV